MPETLEQLAEQAGSLLGAPARWAAAAPGRVNLIGEHVDYNDGLVLPIAIDRWCVAAAHASHDGRWRVLSTTHADAAFPDVLPPHDQPVPADFGTLRGYARGVIATLRALGVMCPPLTIAVASSVPLGAGLSSSASLEVSLATVILGAIGSRGGTPALSLTTLARACQAAEREFAGVNCGVMDQTISLAGRAGHAMLLDCLSGAITHVPLPPRSQASVVVINTNARHSLADSPYAQRRAWCESASTVLGVSSLRALADTPDALAILERLRTALSPDEYRAARHVVTEIHRVRGAADALAAGDLSRVGALMNESHDSLRHDYRVSCDELDVAADAARQTPGVFGARMTGGGFGGCVLALCAPRSVPLVESAVSAAFSSRFSLAPVVFHVEAVSGAAALPFVTQ